MAFKASKIRVKKVAPYGEGKPIIPNVGLAREYESAIQPHILKMFDEYSNAIKKVMGTDQADDFFEGVAMDAGIFDLINWRNKRLDKMFEVVLAALNKKWSKIFNLAAVELLESNLSNGDGKGWCEKAGEAAAKATLFSLKAGGIADPRETYFRNNKDIRIEYGAVVNYNTTLITGIQQESHEKIYGAIMRSITSPNPEEQGMPYIMAEVAKEKDVSTNRLKLIARDQTSKIYGAMGTENMKKNGVMFFRWQHTFGAGSGAAKRGGTKGRVQWRESHEKMDGQVFWIDDPNLWNSASYGWFGRKKGDIGIPGYAINCHCRLVPIVMMTESDWNSLLNLYSEKQVQEWREAA